MCSEACDHVMLRHVATHSLHLHRILWILWSKVPGVHPPADWVAARTERWVSRDSCPSHESHPMHLLGRFMWKNRWKFRWKNHDISGYKQGTSGALKFQLCSFVRERHLTTIKADVVWHAIAPQYETWDRLRGSAGGFSAWTQHDEKSRKPRQACHEEVAKTTSNDRARMVLPNFKGIYTVYIYI